MGFSEDMLNLGEKLVSSCENRRESTRNMVLNTRKMMNKFDSDNRHMAREQRRNLDEFRDNLENNTNKMLRKFKNEHRDMTKKQQENLSDFTGNLTRDTRGFVKKCHKKRSDMHGMFMQAHKNFQNCMHEIERMKRRSPASRPEPRHESHKGKSGRKGRRSH